jgi:hypothetical protein
MVPESFRGVAMPAKTYSITARTTPEAAYAYLADVANHPEWSPDSMTVEREGSGAVGVGTTYRTVGHLQGKPNPAVVEVTQLAAPTRFSFTSTDGNSKWLHEFTVSAADSGARINRRVTVLTAPALLRAIFPLLHPFVIGPGNMKSMGMLRDKLEARAGAGQA